MSDKICSVCHEWAIDEEDFDENFKSCTHCPKAYHRRCVGLYYRSQEMNWQCSKISDKNGRKLQCCPHRASREFIEIDSDVYAISNYYYNRHNKMVTGWSPDGRTYTMSNYPSIIFKGQRFTVGDTIELRNDFEAVHLHGAEHTNVTRVYPLHSVVILNLLNRSA